MSRSQRLLALLQLLRAHRLPVAGARLAEELGVSLRTLYRDIATLQAQGAHIEGEAGVGYVLRPGFMLPPLMFSEEEIEALVLGSRWVAKRTDHHLSAAARSAVSKIASVLPADLREMLDATALLIGPAAGVPPELVSVAQMRLAIRRECKLRIHYRDLKETVSERTIWPFALGYFDHVRLLVAWCETRQDFRHFRVDRVEAMDMLPERYPQRRQALLKAWRAQTGIPASN